MISDFPGLFALPIQDTYNNKKVEELATLYHDLVTRMLVPLGNPAKDPEAADRVEALLWRALFGLYLRQCQEKVKPGLSYMEAKFLRDYGPLAQFLRDLVWERIERECETLEPKFTALPDYGEQMTVGDFVEACKQHSFVNDDGTGRWAMADKISDIYVDCREVAKGLIDNRFTHVVWFNK